MIKVFLLSFSFMILIALQIYPQNYGQWTSAAAMNLPRNHHASVMLPDGRVLVTGGEMNNVSDNVTNSCEVYDYKTNTWSYVDSMNVARFYHKLILLDSNRVLAVGGYNIKSCEIYNIKDNKWSFTDSLKSTRLYGATVTLLKNGKVLISGGYNYIAKDIYLNDVELYDPLTNKWSITDSLKVGRFGHTATLLNDGRLLIAGGAGKECEIFDPTIDKWSVADSLNDGRYEQSAVLLSSGQVLVSGGADSNITSSHWLNSCEVYDPKSNKWSIVTSMLSARAEHSSIMLNDGSPLFTGGSFGNESWELYNPTSFTNIYLNNYPFIISNPEVVLLKNGNVVSFGGLQWTNSSTPIVSSTAICEIYSPSVDGIEGKTSSSLNTFELSQNYPNPFNPATIINYQIPKEGIVTIKIFDTLGKEVKTLVNAYKSQGKYSVSFDASHLASGVYFYRMQAGSFVETRKLILMK